MTTVSMRATLAIQGSPAPAADAGRLQEAQARELQAQVEAQLAQQQAARDAQQAARDAQQAGRDAQREAQQAIREAQREIQRAVREGRPGMPVQFPPFPGSGPQIPEGVVIISVAFFVMCAVIAIGVPIVRAFTRRMDRRGAPASGADAETRGRLERIEQAVDAIAVEVERISEGQRFTTKIIGDLRALPQPEPAAALAERVGSPLSRAREAR